MHRTDAKPVLACLKRKADYARDCRYIISGSATFGAADSKKQPMLCMRAQKYRWSSDAKVDHFSLVALRNAFAYFFSATVLCPNKDDIAELSIL